MVEEATQTPPKWAKEISDEIPRLVKMHDDLEQFVYKTQLKNMDPRQSRLMLREKELLKEIIGVMKGRLNLLLDRGLK